MAINDFNNLRVDLLDIYKECEHRTSLHSRVFEANSMNQEIVICRDDYPVLHSFANTAASIIADNSNYITHTNQTGFEALTSSYTPNEPNLFDDNELIDLDEREKQTGELLVKGEMDTLDFGITNTEGVDIKRYSIVQTYMRNAILEYILFKWYSDNRINDESRKAWDQFTTFKDHLRFNSIANIKRKKLNRKYRLY